MKWAKDMKRNLTEEDIDMANKHMRKCSASLAIREIQIKTTMRYHLTPVRIGKINKAGNHKCWRRCGLCINGILLSCQKGQIPTICFDMDGTGGYYAE